MPRAAGPLPPGSARPLTLPPHAWLAGAARMCAPPAAVPPAAGRAGRWHAHGSRRWRPLCRSPGAGPERGTGPLTPGAARGGAGGRTWQAAGGQEGGESRGLCISLLQSKRGGGTSGSSGSGSSGSERPSQPLSPAGLASPPCPTSPRCPLAAGQCSDAPLAQTRRMPPPRIAGPPAWPAARWMLLVRVNPLIACAC